MLPSRALTGLSLLALALPLAACGGGDDGAPSADGDGTTITVLAAASLTGTFTDLAKQFEDDHPGVTVKLAFDSSATLAQQALDGAPADVLATADEATMDSAADALAADPQVFATNTMVLVTPADNPAQITDFGDLDTGGATFVACVDTAPCGKVAAALFQDNDLTAKPASLEVDVKAVLAKVTSDEADAGFVYRTDAVAAGEDVRSVDIPHAEDEVTTYPIAPLDQSRASGLAGEFVDLVLSTEGQQVLADAGFGKP
ncbi:molybdate ABC transporter substrate-binding protein [Nocardioides sp. KIGAM211]|uniref:Molybdate ABC transporter substrate-binding protein n=1 Tax=Nocardioides luti TaxID=2761101 RepID=A0A7X0VAH6_9ACTN|nr:molybdate ABC transporter substrate-binding protein [Nocardioides luti]